MQLGLDGAVAFAGEVEVTKIPAGLADWLQATSARAFGT